jgi:hypothetical protein
VNRSNGKAIFPPNTQVFISTKELESWEEILPDEYPHTESTPSETDSASVNVDNEQQFKEVVALEFPEGLRIIGSDVCAELPKLKNLIIPGSVDLIQEGAFSNCKNLGTVKFAQSDSDLTIRAKVFANTPLYWLTIIRPKGKIRIGEHIVAGSAVRNVKLCGEQIHIETRAFSNHTVETVTLSGDATIVYSAFGPFLKKLDISKCGQLTFLYLNSPPSRVKLSEKKKTKCFNMAFGTKRPNIARGPIIITPSGPEQYVCEWVPVEQPEKKASQPVSPAAQ